MGDYLQKVVPGQPMRIPAETYNRLMDMLRWWLGDSIGGGAGVGPGGRQATILIRNDTDTDLPQFAVLGIDGVVFTPDDNEDEFRRRQCYIGIAPTVAVHFGGWFCILTEPLPADEIGRAVLDGVTPVKINVVDEDHWFADVADDDTAKLTSGPDGAAQILVKEPGTGEKWAVVRLGIGTNDFWAKITDRTEISSDPHRFEYSFEEVKKTDTGYDGWASVSGGLSGTAYNGDEFADLFGWCSDRVVGMVVRMRRVQFGSTVEYWFNAWNVS